MHAAPDSLTVPARVGIAGPSCSGKTTVARLLAARLGARLFSLDDYYVRGHAPRHVVHPDGPVRSREHPGAYDGPALLADMLAHPGPVVAEGFLLLAYPGVAGALGLAAFVDVPWPEIARRRRARRGQCRPDVDEAFERVGASEWEAFGAAQADLPGVVRLDGTLPPADLAEALAGLAAARFTIP